MNPNWVGSALITCDAEHADRLIAFRLPVVDMLLDKHVSAARAGLFCLGNVLGIMSIFWRSKVITGAIVRVRTAHSKQAILGGHSRG